MVEYINEYNKEKRKKGWMEKSRKRRKDGRIDERKE